ncbi:MAG TPA: ribonuclease III family protein [Candidatus Methanofastidiosa archaeon]|nr:ribonuclease III family protein [Candidatus Methanofastidiosa archaeon]
MNDSNLSKFGDVLVNFLFSAAYLGSKGLYDGFKVTNHVLMQALNNSRFKAPPRSDKHQRGDYVEALIAKAWGRLLTMDEMVSLLSDSIADADMGSRESSTDAQIRAFTVLLDEIYERASGEQLL